MGALQNVWVPFNIYIMAEASDFKFGTQLGFAKAHHEITPREKRGGGLGLEKLPKILGFPIIFMQRLGLRTSNLVYNTDLPRPTIKLHPQEKWAWPWARETPNIWGSPLIFLQRPRCSLSVSGASCYSNSPLHCSSYILNSIMSAVLSQFPDLAEELTTLSRPSAGSMEEDGKANE